MNQRKAAKTQKHLKEIPYQPKKAFKKKTKYYTSKDKCPNFTNFFRMAKLAIQIYWMRNRKNLKGKYQKHLLGGAAKIYIIFPK